MRHIKLPTGIERYTSKPDQILFEPASDDGAILADLKKGTDLFFVITECHLEW